MSYFCVFRLIEHGIEQNRPKGGDFFDAVFIHELVIRLFDYSIFTARARMDSPREGDATIFFNFEWP